MTGPDDAERLRQARTSRAGVEPPATPQCLDDDALAALAEGTADAAARATGLAHLSGCGRCRRAVASVARALANPAVSSEVRALERAARPRSARFGQLALTAAAAAAVLLLAWPPPLEVGQLAHRAPPITASPAPEAVWPVGIVAEARSLRWTPVSGADRYRVTLYATGGTVRYEAESPGTEIALPDSVLPVPGQAYWWKVDARLGFDRWAASTLIEFSVGESPPR